MNGLLDRALDLTVVGGYTNVGYRLRRGGWDALPRMDGRTVLVTGATAGLGREAAAEFAELGARVLLVARNAERGEQAREEIGGSAELRLCDVSDLDSVRALAERLLGEEERLDVLVHNAGVLPPAREVTPAGHELTLATNVLGPFLLTELLLPLLERSAPSRVITVASGGMYTQRLDVDDLQSERGTFDGTRAYANTKRAEVVLNELWAERHAGRGIAFHAMHPGWADTPGVASSLPRFHRVMGPLLRDAREGADTIVWLGAAAEPAASSGRFWHDRRTRPTHLAPWTHERPGDRERLWRACERLTGLGDR